MNSCSPSCVDGHFHAYPALLIFWGSALVKNHPSEHAYKMMTEILTGTRPRYYDYQTHKWVTEPDNPDQRPADQPRHLHPGHALIHPSRRGPRPAPGPAVSPSKAPLSPAPARPAARLTPRRSPQARGVPQPAARSLRLM